MIRIGKQESVRGGFTLTDLVVALVLIAAVASLAVPSFFERAEVTLEKAAILLAKDLRAAQNRAAYISRDVQVQFDEAGDGYRIDDGIYELGEATELRRSYDRDAVFRGVRITDVALGEGETLLYDTRGVPKTGARITLEFQGDQRIVHVEAETGRLSIDGSTSHYTDDGY